MWCDLQQGNRDRLPVKESKLFLTFSSLLQPQSTLWVSTRMELYLDIAFFWCSIITTAVIPKREG